MSTQGMCKLAAALILGVASWGASAQTKWDMPTPYPATNFHTENVAAIRW